MAKTIIQAPGNGTNAGFVAQSVPQVAPKANVSGPSRPSTPLVGFLYSVSRTAQGEYWPIYGGNNAIGHADGNIVKLNDPQVEATHAYLVAQNRMEQGKKVGVTVYLRDNASMSGTLLNGNSVQLEPQICKHGDIITIGPNYELYLVLVDASELGLTQCAALQNLPEEKAPAPANNGWQPSQPGMFAGANPKGTVVQNAQGGSNPLNASSTIYMPKQ